MKLKYLYKSGDFIRNDHNILSDDKISILALYTYTSVLFLTSPIKIKIYTSVLN